MEPRGMRRVWSGVVLAVLISGGAAWGQAAGEASASARAILEATGIRGGLAVQVNCGDGRLIAELGAQPGFLLQGLARTEAEVQAARAYLMQQGLYGPVSVDRWDGAHLPYADNLVNLLVCEDGAAPDATEMARVLAPNGVAYVRRDGQWAKTVKPWPKDIDEWTHYLHDATGNPVAQDDRVGPPRRLQWVGSPRWARHHDHMASMTSLVSARGRLFYIFDEGPTASIQLPSQWRLIARDGFSGTVLWKREIPEWNTRQWPLKSGPADLTRRLVAEGDRVYVTLGLEAPLTALDAATGETVRTYAGSDRTREVILSQGTLLAVVGLEPSKRPEWRRRDSYVWDNTRRANSEWAWNLEKRKIRAYEASSGRQLWETEAPVAPCSLAADGTRVIYYDGEKVICLGQSDGQVRWQSEPVKASVPIQTGTGVRTVLYRDIVLFAGNTGTMTALSAQDGRKLWDGQQHPSGHMSLRDLIVAGGLVWSGEVANGKDSGVFTGRDPLTGEVKNEFLPDVETYWFHHRCYPSKATENYILTSRTGIEFVDWQRKHWEAHHWVRGGCIYGVLPCNGLVYAPMHSCGCYLESKLYGFNALAAGPVPEPDPATLTDEARLERGPAYEPAAQAGPAGGQEAAEEWPTYRHDIARSGATPAGARLGPSGGWKAKLGGRLTAPVIAGGRLFVASVDTHTLYALDAQTGETRWSYTAGGRIDSPPTIYRGLALFGSADGYVYALRAADGALAWRFRAAPVDRRVVAFEQLESAWPVHGSVLVRDGVLYCTAGRSIFLDGGIRLLELEALTGKKLSEVVMDEKDPETGKNMQVYVKGLNMPVALSDILSCDGEYLYMRSQKITLDGRRLEIPVEDVGKQPAEGSHLFCQIGFLDDSWFHRSYWTYGRRVTGGYGGWYQAARYVPAGRILVFDDQHVYGYGRKPEYFVNASVLEYQLFESEKQASPEAVQRVRRANGEMNMRLDKNSANSSDWKLRRAFPVEDLTAAHYDWTVNQPSLQIRAMVAAGDTLLVAGHPDFIDERRAYRLPDDAEVQQQLVRQAEALDGRYGGLLWAVAKADGRVLARYRLDSPPVFDGLAAADGRLFLSARDGSVMCLAQSGPGAVKALGETEPLSVISDEPEEPNYLRPPEADKSADFTNITRCRVTEGELGYRVRPTGDQNTCLVLQKQPEPLTGKVTLRTQLRVERTEGFLVNGFLVFGDGPAEEKLTQCGIRYQPQKALIVQGSLKGDSKSKSGDVNAPLGKVLDLTVVVDLPGQKVTFTTCGRTVEMPLERALASITHLGFGTDNAIAEFAPVKIER